VDDTVAKRSHGTAENALVPEIWTPRAADHATQK